MITCSKIQPGWFKNTLTLKASEYEEIIFDSFCGERKFYVRPGSIIKTKCKKSANITPGDTLPLKEWILGPAECNAFDFPWDWEYGDEN